MSSPSLELPKSTREMQPDTAESVAVLHELQGTGYTLSTKKPQQGETPIAGLLLTGSSMFEAMADKSIDDPTEFVVVDMRSAPRNPENNWPVYDGFDWPENTEYLVLQPSSYNQNKFRGYAALHKGKRVVLGRNNKHFDGTELISRNHASLEVTDEGLHITDLESTNGTSWLEYEQKETKADSHHVGSKAMHAARYAELADSKEFSDEEEAIIAANLDLMLSSSHGIGKALAAESIGGNAGNLKIDGKTYQQGAANAYVETSGQLIKFSNYPDDKPKDRPTIEATYVAAFPRFEFVNGMPKVIRPESWTKDQHITRTFINREPLEKGIEKGWVSERTAKILEETARRYNLIPSNK